MHVQMWEHFEKQANQRGWDVEKASKFMELMLVTKSTERAESILEFFRKMQFHNTQESYNGSTKVFET